MNISQRIIYKDFVAGNMEKQSAINYLIAFINNSKY